MSTKPGDTESAGHGPIVIKHDHGILIWLIVAVAIAIVLSLGWSPFWNFVRTNVQGGNAPPVFVQGSPSDTGSGQGRQATAGVHAPKPSLIEQDQNVQLDDGWQPIPGDTEGRKYLKDAEGHCDIARPHGLSMTPAQSTLDWLEQNCKPKT